MTGRRPGGGADAQGSSSGLRVRFGTHRVRPPFDQVEVVEALNTDARARVILDATQLAGGPVEYRGESGIEEIQPPAGELRPLFGGWVSRVELSGPTATVDMRSGPQLDEARLDRFSHAAGITDTEVVWSVAQFAGYRPDQLRIAGLRPIREDFDVFMPVRGLAIETELAVGTIRLTSDRAAVEAAIEPLPDEKGKAIFLEGDVWAVARTSATMLLEAERTGVASIEGELDRLALEAQYSLGAAPDGSVQPFDRASLFADPAVDPFVLVRGTATPRAWLHSLRMLPFRPSVGARRVALDTPSVGRSVRFDEALRAWRRAVRATDAIETVVAVWEAVEFYVSGTTVPVMFSDAELKAAVAALAGLGLSDSQRDRLRDVIGSANSAPLFVRLRAALDGDDVPYSEEELSTLKRLRAFRNDIVHGRAKSDPARNDLEMAKAFVNRMLAFRGAAALRT